MTYLFTADEARSILEDKGSSAEEIAERVKSESLKMIMKDLKIGYNRLLAVVKALEISANKNQKISVSVSKLARKEQIIREAHADKEEILRELTRTTPEVVRAQFRVSDYWLKDLMTLHGISPITFKEAHQKSMSTRSDKAYREFKAENIELIGRLVEENAPKSVMLNHVKSGIRLERLLREEYPEWFSFEAKARRNSKTVRDYNKSPKRQRAIIEARGKTVELSRERISDEALFSLVVENVASWEEIQDVLNTGEINTALILSERLGVSLQKYSHERNTARAFREKGYSTNLEDYPALKKAQEHFSFEVPLELSQNQPTFIANLIIQNRQYLSWFMSQFPQARRFDFSDLLPSVSPQKFGQVVKDFGLEDLLSNKPDPYIELASNLALDLTELDHRELLAQKISNKELRSLKETCKFLGISINQGRQLQNRGLIPQAWSRSSNFEIQVRDVLEHFNIDYDWNITGVLPNKRNEIDFWIPSKNIAIEVNPTFTHNSTYGWSFKESNAKSKFFHSERVRLAREAGIEMIMLYERDLVEPNFSQITIPFLKYKLLGPERIFYGRNITVSRAEEKLERNKAREFLQKYHSQGSAKAKEYYCLNSPGGELLGVLSFDYNPQLAKGETNVWELKRMAFAPGVQVRYGLSKVIAQLKRDIPSCKVLYSYSRNDMGSGRAYEATGFELIRDTGPGLSYVNPRDPNDFYSWSINSPWGAKAGILARFFDQETLENHDRRALIIEHLPHRNDNGKGYVEVYNSGSRLWRLTLD